MLPNTPDPWCNRWKFACSWTLEMIWRLHAVQIIRSLSETLLRFWWFHRVCAWAMSRYSIYHLSNQNIDTRLRMFNFRPKRWRRANTWHGGKSVVLLPEEASVGDSEFTQWSRPQIPHCRLERQTISIIQRKILLSRLVMLSVVHQCYLCFPGEWQTGLTIIIEHRNSLHFSPLSSCAILLRSWNHIKLNTEFIWLYHG